MSAIVSDLHKLFIAFTFLVFFHFAAAEGSPPNVVNLSEIGIVDLNERILIYPDSNRIMDIHGILNGKKRFLHGQSRYSGDVNLWGSVSFFNDLPTDKEIVVQLSNDFDADKVEVYILQNGQIIDKKNSGHFLSDFERSVPYVHNAFVKLKIRSNDELNLIAVAYPISGHPVKFSLQALPIEEWYAQIRRSDFTQSLILGFLAILVLFNLIMFFQTLDKTYVFYGTYIFGFGLFSCILYGYLDFMESGHVRRYLFPSSLSIALIAYVNFFINFVNLSLFAPKWFRIIKIGLRVFWVILIALFVGFVANFNMEIHYLDIIMKCITMIFIAYFILLPLSVIGIKNPISKYAVVGSLVLLTGMIIAIFDNFVNQNQTNIYGQLGIIGELVVFSIGMGARVKKIAMDRKLAHERLISQLKKNESLQIRMNRKLERTVEKRTKKILNQNYELEFKAAELEDVNEELKRANQFKNKLFAIIGHDLRNPLGTMKGVLELNNKGQIEPEDMKLLSKDLEKSLNEALNMLDNLLTWALQHLEDVRCVPCKISAYEIAQNNVELMLPHAKRKGISIKNEADPELFLFADYEMMKLVFRNLLNNAIKFTEEGGSIRISSYSIDNMGRLVIWDNGVGISKEVLDKIKAEEDIISTPGTKNEKGTGIGLKLCKDFIRRNNGKIWIESVEGEGSKVTVELPKYVDEIAFVDV